MSANRRMTTPRVRSSNASSPFGQSQSSFANRKLVSSGIAREALLKVTMRGDSLSFLFALLLLARFRRRGRHAGVSVVEEGSIVLDGSVDVGGSLVFGGASLFDGSVVLGRSVVLGEGLSLSSPFSPSFPPPFPPRFPPTPPPGESCQHFRLCQGLGICFTVAHCIECQNAVGVC